MANLIALKFASIKNSKTRLGSAIFIKQIRGGQKIGDFRTWRQKIAEHGALAWESWKVRF